QRRSQTDRRAVGVLREHAVVLQLLAQASPAGDARIEVDAGPQPADAVTQDPEGVEPREALLEDGLEAADVVLHVPGLEELDDGLTDGAGQRVPSEGRAVLADA